jgi:hypothetical protein
VFGKIKISASGQAHWLTDVIYKIQLEATMELRQYTTAVGKNVFDERLASLRNERVQARIAARLDRLCAGNFGDCKPVGDSVDFESIMVRVIASIM